MTRGLDSRRFDRKGVPVFIVCRDRLRPLQNLVVWLESAGHENLLLIDNASSYGPLLEYFDHSPHLVIRLDTNLGPHKSVWQTGILDRFAGNKYYIVSDCDVVPDKECPTDLASFLNWTLQRYPKYVKSGPALRIDDLPAHYDLGENVRRWEARFWIRQFGGNLYDAPIDTTFALYRPNSSFVMGPAIRTGAPYLARHLPWYACSDDLGSEDLYYRDHAQAGVTHWAASGHNSTAGRAATPNDRVRWIAHRALKLRCDRSIPRRYGGEDA